MNRKRLSRLLASVGIAQTPAEESNVVPSAIALRALDAMRLTPTEVAAAHRISREANASFTGIGMGLGFASWLMYEASHGIATTVLNVSVDLMLGHAEKWTGFVIDAFLHPDKWPDTAHFIAHAIENMATIPSGSIQLAADVIDAWTHGGNFLENLDALDIGADIADVADAATTLGLSIAVGYIAGKITETIFEEKLRPKRERLQELRESATEVYKLQQMLKLRFSPPAIAPQLDQVAEQQWGF